MKRRRLDRRLPPPVARLYRNVAQLWIADVRRRAIARVRPILQGGGAADVVVRQGQQRLTVVDQLHSSLDDLAHEYAGEVLAALTQAGIDAFLHDRDHFSLSFGLELDDRARALEALAARLVDGWYLDWEDGALSGTVPMRAASRSNHVSRARRWSIYQPRAWGELAVGGQQAAHVTFWQLGASGQNELVGTRGQERFDPRSATTVEEVDGRSYRGVAAFPLGSGLEFMTDPIDIVYTWVDGSDPTWLADFRATSAAFGRQLDEVALDPARYHNRDELKYSLRSVWAFCGWARRIFIVTAGQVPGWLTDDDRIRIVDHREILPPTALPTFNSHAMEASLHRIDGLSEHFIYFNDDMLIGRAVRPETFFTSNGLPRVFQGDARVSTLEDADTLAVDTAARRGRELLDQRFGRVVASKPMHSPYPLLRSVMEEIEREFADVVGATMHSRFRSPSDLSIAASFAQHYALATGRAVLGQIACDYVHVESGRLKWHLNRLQLGRAYETFCINETEQQPHVVNERETLISSFFERYYPIAAPWEADPAGAS